MDKGFDPDRPIYIQLIERVKVMIASGEYPPGSRVPPVRELAGAASVNPNTMQRAFSELERQGLINTQRTTGRYITEDEEMIDKLKRELAVTHVKTFLDGMKAIGISAEEAQRMILDFAPSDNDKV